MSACHKCGHPIEGRPNFCPACGASLTFNEGGELTTTDPLIDRMIDGKFTIEGLIGEGAMGRVYRAQYAQLKKPVALKILRSNLVSDPTVVKRFEREALAASRLNHPNCISIYGFGSEDEGDLLWMAMELVEGRDLGTIIAEDSPLSTLRVLHIMTQVCEALDEAHTANIIHRDLKPANIVCFKHRHNADFVKVLDFGIAKIVDPDTDQPALTRDGIVCGTPAYMSPEQVQGFELDQRSDLFSLGIILYQAITNRLPFFDESAVGVATKIVIEDPLPPSEQRPDWSYPKELEAVVMRLLSKKKEERYDNALEVKRALQEVDRILRERQDVSLDLPPDQVAKLLEEMDKEPAIEGSETLQLETEKVSQALSSPEVPGVEANLAPLPPPVLDEAPEPPSSVTDPTLTPDQKVPTVTRNTPRDSAPDQEDMLMGAPAATELAPNGPGSTPDNDLQLMTEPARRPNMPSPRPEDRPARRDGGSGMMVGLGIITLAALGAGLWFFFAR
ncbi:MAG: protein kinase domain-containing protein [Bradymonadia bacterium]